MRRPHFTGGLGYGASSIVPITVSHAWVGNVTATGATVKARSTDATSMTLRYSTDPGLAGYSEVSGTEGNDDVWTFALSGLTADTAYYFGFAGSDLAGQFRTFPTVGTAHSFTIVAAGDSGLSPDYAGATANVANPPTWDRMLEHDPLLCIVLGDWHYRDLNTSAAASYRTAYKDVLAETRVNDFVRQVPTAYVYDDHDGGPDDHDGTYAHKATAQSVYREYVPHWTLPSASAIYHTFVVGRVRFINLDVRSERSPNSATDDASKTRLGATQKQWLKDTVNAATEPVIGLNVMSWIGGTTAFADGWDSFSTERTELFDYFVSVSKLDNLWLIGADIHELMDDDGTNTNFETGAVDPGPPYSGFAPIDASFNDFSATPLNKYQTRKQQYGTMRFDDTGTQITVTAKGWALSTSPGATSSEVFSRSKVYSG